MLKAALSSILGGAPLPVHISGAAPDATAGVAYDYGYTTDGPTQISSADAAALAVGGLTYNGATGHLSGANPA